MFDRKSELEISVRFSPALKVVLLAKNYTPIKQETSPRELTSKLIKCGRLLANPETQTILCTIITNPLRENSTLS